MDADNQNEEEVKRLQRSVELDPSRASVHVELGQALGDLGRNEEALQAMNQALALEPDNDWALQLKGCVLYDLGRMEEAIEVSDNALALDPGSILALCLKNCALNDLGREEEAIKALRRAVEICPGLSGIDLQEKLYKDLQGMNRYEEALEVLDAVLALAPDNAEALVAKEEILAKSSRRKHIQQSEAGDEVKQDLFGTMDFDKYQESLRQTPDPSLLAGIKTGEKKIRFFCVHCGEYGKVSEEDLYFFSEEDGFEIPKDLSKYYLEISNCKCRLATIKSTLKKIPQE